MEILKKVLKFLGLLRVTNGHKKHLLEEQDAKERTQRTEEERKWGIDAGVS